PQMQQVAGGQFMDWTQEAVVGLWDVIVKYPYFREKFYQMYRDIRRLEPDAVIFVDYPGFNLRLAHYLRRKQFSGKLIYYISPQVWAWNRGRIPRMAAFLDLMLCIFPFEKSLYEASGLKTNFFISPPILAWNPGKKPGDGGFLDLMLFIFPFEKSLYEASGLKTEFIGHPMIEELERHRINGPRAPNLVALLPGSRN